MVSCSFVSALFTARLGDLTCLSLSLCIYNTLVIQCLPSHVHVFPVVNNGHVGYSTYLGICTSSVLILTLWQISQGFCGLLVPLWALAVLGIFCVFLFCLQYFWMIWTRESSFDAKCFCCCCFFRHHRVHFLLLWSSLHLQLESVWSMYGLSHATWTGTELGREWTVKAVKGVSSRMMVLQELSVWHGWHSLHDCLKPDLQKLVKAD